MNTHFHRLFCFLKEQMVNFLWEMLKISPLLVIIGASMYMFDRMKGWPFMQNNPQIPVALMSLSITSIVLIGLNIARQFLIPQFKLGASINKAMKHPIGAAIVCLAVMFFLTMMVYVTVAHSVTDEAMLERAGPYLPILESDLVQYWPDVPDAQNEPAQIEQESMWKQFAELKTSREHGIGFSQMTIAYNANGTERFNKFKEVAQRYKQLSRWDWKNDLFNVRYHLLFVTLEDHRNFRTYTASLQSATDRWAATLVCYNAGCGAVNSRLSVCRTTNGCDPRKWFGGLDSVASASEKSAMLYGRSLAKERNKYPDLVIHTRSLKYKYCFMCH